MGPGKSGKRSRRRTGQEQGKGLNSPKGRYAPNGGTLGKKYFGKKSVFLTLSFGSIRAAVSEILGGSGGENRYLIMDGGQQYLKGADLSKRVRTRRI